MADGVRACGGEFVPVHVVVSGTARTELTAAIIADSVIGVRSGPGTLGRWM